MKEVASTPEPLRVHPSYRLAVCQLEPVFRDCEANLRKMEDQARRAAMAGAELVIFPECSLTGYGPGALVERMVEAAEPATGPERAPSVRRLEALSAELCTWIIFGMAEKTDRGVYNSSLLVSPWQGVVGVYHKSHMWDCEGKFFEPGEAFRVYDTPLGRLGMLICFDLEFPEAGRILSLAGAQLLAVSTANMRPWEEYQRVYARARAMENGVFVAVANRLGFAGETDFFGGSIIVDPYGNVLAEAGRSEAVLTADIDLGLIDRAMAGCNYFEKRRPDLYGPLVRSPR